MIFHNRTTSLARLLSELGGFWFCKRKSGASLAVFVSSTSVTASFAFFVLLLSGEIFLLAVLVEFALSAEDADSFSCRFGSLVRSEPPDFF